MPLRVTIEKRPFTVNLTLILVLFLAALWLVFSIFTLVGANSSLEALAWYRWLMAAVAFFVALGLIVIDYLLMNHYQAAWRVAIIFMAAIFVAGFLDQIGWVDINYMGLALLPVILLIKDRKWYLDHKKLIKD